MNLNVSLMPEIWEEITDLSTCNSYNSLQQWIQQSSATHEDSFKMSAMFQKFFWDLFSELMFKKQNLICQQIQKAIQTGFAIGSSSLSY
jgi:hypothetical protein